MVNDSLKVAVATGHIPVSEVSKKLTKEIIVSKAKALNKSLKKDFMIRKPKIAVLALNPHAGDNGLIGNEEIEYINDTLESLQDDNVMVYGPFPADGFFGTGMYDKYDAILAMYHDQGLVPFKTLSFQSGVNYTAGLPYVRTSPDHGTAYSIAGKGEASEDSFRKAVYEAIDIFRSRTENKDLESNKIDSKEVAQFLSQKRQSYNQKNKSRPAPRRFENKSDQEKPRDSRENREDRSRESKRTQKNDKPTEEVEKKVNKEDIKPDGKPLVEEKKPDTKAEQTDSEQSEDKA